MSRSKRGLVIRIGIAAGFPDGTYRPADNVNRTQMAVMLVATFNLAIFL